MAIYSKEFYIDEHTRILINIYNTLIMWDTIFLDSI